MWHSEVILRTSEKGSPGRTVNDAREGRQAAGREIVWH